MVMRLRMPAPDWQQAMCLDESQHTETYDPYFDNTDEGGADQTALGLEICNGIDGRPCPIREGCLQFATLNNERFGVWGGMTEQDRRLMRKLFPWDGKRPTEVHPEWRWYSPDELRALVAGKIERGEISEQQVEREDDDDD